MLLMGWQHRIKMQNKLSFLEIKTSVKSKLNQNVSALNQRRFRMEQVLQFEDECIQEEEQDVLTQLLQTQKNELIDLQDHLEKFCYIFPVSGFNSAKHDINLIKSYLLPFLVIVRGIEPIVIKKANRFVTFKLGDVQMLVHFFKLSRMGYESGFFPEILQQFREEKVWFLECFKHPEKLNNTKLPPYKTSFSKLRNKNPLEKDYSDFQSLIDVGLTSKEALSKMNLKQPPAGGQENYQNLASVWQQENMRTFKDLLRWYNNKDVVPTLEVIQKMVGFYHKKELTC